MRLRRVMPMILTFNGLWNGMVFDIDRRLALGLIFEIRSQFRLTLLQQRVDAIGLISEVSSSPRNDMHVNVGDRLARSCPVLMVSSLSCVHRYMDSTHLDSDVQ